MSFREVDIRYSFCDGDYSWGDFEMSRKIEEGKFYIRLFLLLEG